MGSVSTMGLMRAGLAAFLLLPACTPVKDGAMYMVDGVRMEVTRDRTIVDTSQMQAPDLDLPDPVVFGPTAISQGMVVRRADGQPVAEADRPRAQAAFSLYCAAKGERAPESGLIFDRADRPTAFFGLCVQK